ncbi:hypothetical protein [Actinomyces ruminicola]|uniref:hypothetical protein n=1 Tax=Actinomyces ruminicola TaxID=332524 RepID=UPI0011C86757|nr:hypothetical protein [Actinomyces ruminicola]
MPEPHPGATAAPQQPTAPGVLNAALMPLTRGPALATVGLTALVVFGTALLSAVLLLAGVSMTGDEDLPVTAELSLDGERFEVPLAVRAGDKDFGLLNNWEIGTPLIRAITLQSDSLDTVTFGGTEVTLEEADYIGASATRYVYFGVYALGVDETKPDYLEPDTDSVTAGGSSGTTVEVEAEATETLNNLVLDAVNARQPHASPRPGT